MYCIASYFNVDDCEIQNKIYIDMKLSLRNMKFPYEDDSRFASYQRG